MAVEMLGKVAIQDGDQKAATEWFGRLVELTPNKLQSWELLAGAAIQASDVNAGAKAFRRIMELDPSRNHWADMGALLLQEQRWGEAAEALGKAVQRGGASARVRLAWMYARLAEAGSRGGSVPAGLLEEAEAEVRKALEADQGDRQAQELLRLVREIRRG